MNNQQSKIYRFKISLLDIEPQIWRIIEVPQEYTFWDLHVAIQDAMGWLDYHLHSFEPTVSGKSSPKPIGLPETPNDDMFLAGWTIPIKKYFESKGDTARYEYDFGDGWLHQIELLAIESIESTISYPRCTDGERACPPEDCGGVPGYYRLIEIIAEPSNNEYETMRQWLKGHDEKYFPYDPDEFDPQSVNFRDPQKRWNIIMGLES
ncbi:plasmid pRiA4b ORF-3 family protein [Fodinibius halophilus]|uniref:Plasmid pRiA4b ORF-3 family protein n=1 Tax=Fodinibius halophilus TaxID=1736908 RepID=A0A6M1SWT1_9BACT|nr:plasmid pRiA4b ORF-3 family protein [Fodinibius halophilus]NGP88016.1 plasmid pRiA4b ORF-3 family protein [Fodinibius halophilus]